MPQALDHEETAADVAAELKRIGDQVKESGEKALSEASKAGDLSKATKERVDELLVKQGELQARLQEIEQKADALGRGGAGEAVPKSAGHELTASAEYVAYLKAGDFRKPFTFGTKAIVNITSDPASAGVLIEAQRLPGIQRLPDPQLRVRDLLTPGRTNSNLIQYVRETGYQNMAGTVAEGTRKPQSDMSFEDASTAVVKIATFVKATTEIISDAPMLQSYIDGRLRLMLAIREDAQLLKGSGVGNNLHGIFNQASAYAAPIAIPGATDIDTLRLAILQAELAEFPATGLVLNPINWTRIELTKDSTGAYLFANPQGIAAATLWRRPVVTTTAMDVGAFLAGAFQLGAQIFDRQQAAVTISTENEDDFVNNRVTILAEERLALAVYRPTAFVKGTLAA